MFDLLLLEAKTGFRRLVGTRLSGAVPLGEALLNELLGHLPQIPPGLTLEVLPTNRLVARYGLIQAAAVLDEAVRTASEAPQITLDLQSRVLAWALARAVRLPAVRIDGRRLTIDVGALAGAEAFGQLWPHLDRVRLRTTTGQVHLDFEIVVR